MHVQWTCASAHCTHRPVIVVNASYERPDHRLEYLNWRILFIVVALCASRTGSPSNTFCSHMCHVWCIVHNREIRDECGEDTRTWKHICVYDVWRAALADANDANLLSFRRLRKGAYHAASFILLLNVFCGCFVSALWSSSSSTSSECLSLSINKSGLCRLGSSCQIRAAIPGNV